MFLAIRELKHSKVRYLLIGLIMVLVAWLVFIISGLANGLSAENASSILCMDEAFSAESPLANPEMIKTSHATKTMINPISK